MYLHLLSHTLPTEAYPPIVAKFARMALLPRTRHRRSSQNFPSRHFGE
jgi:hypothetical protein